MGFIFTIWLPIGIGLLLLFGVFRFVYIEKYAQSILKDPEANKARFLEYEKKTVRLLKISLWPALLLLIMLPLATFLLFREYLFVITADMVLSSILILYEHSFRKWLINYLEARETL